METLQKPHVVVVNDDVDVNESSHHHQQQSDDEGQRRSSSQSGSCSEIVKERGSSVSEVDLEHGTPEIKLHLAKVERDCRICHLSLDAGSLEGGVPIELGCSCKNDLAAAHKQYGHLPKVGAFGIYRWRYMLIVFVSTQAVREYLVKTPARIAELDATNMLMGTTCEICGSIARNVAGANETGSAEQWNQASDVAVTAAPPVQPADTRNFWQGHRFLNFLLACMVFAFVISWLFHFNVPS
ncbi:hypothetical protein POTOM_038613 [Populus tomentosa]|uniref:RING-CH-type domain-containing protein n=1 Tax=Populus tomentosa TaxID=118781 RepID=A0A8X7Z7G5_POPTO|nr:hypothetical protein POTOM_038613 [Populus tomentosa]